MEKAAIVSHKDGKLYTTSHLSSAEYLVVVSSDDRIYSLELPSYIRGAPLGERGPKLKRYIEENFDDGLGTLVTVRSLQVEGPYPWKRNAVVPEETDAIETAKRFTKK